MQLESHLPDFHRSKNHKPATVRLTRAAVRHFHRLGFDKLDDVSLAGYRDARQAEGRAADTIRGELTKLISLANWLGLEPVVAKPAKIQRIPQAWSRSDLRKLFREARETKRVIWGLPGKIYWPALLGVCYDTGERIGAITAIDWGAIDLKSRTIYYRAEVRKGGYRDAMSRISRHTAKSVRKLRDAHGEPQELAFRYGAKNTVWRAYTRLLNDAGLPSDRRSKFHRLRRTHATYVHQAGGDATAALGHASDATTRACYIDPRFLASRLPWRPWWGW